jgi:hypothetical protein
MKSILNYIILLTGLTVALAACEKVDDLPQYAKGEVPVLSSSVNAIAPAPADSLNTAVTFSWTDAKYATGTALQKYIVEIDTAGNGFKTSSSKTVLGELNISFTSKEINDILQKYRYKFGVAQSMEVRLISSYANNNERYISNVLAMQMTPYKVPPKVPVPTSEMLFIVGSATRGDWANPVTLPSQQFSRISETYYEGTFYLNGGGKYLLLPVNGQWDKYSVADNAVVGLSNGGAFGYNLKDDFPAPAKSGWYTIGVNFQDGVFTVAPYLEILDVPSLYVPGDYQDWDPASAYRLVSKNNDGKYKGYVYFPTGGTYEFKITSDPDWGHTNYGDDGGGKLNAGGGGNLKVAGEGFYLINADINALTWSAAKEKWGEIGSATPGGWNSDTDMVFDPVSKLWSVTLNLVAGEMKFRSDDSWSFNLGDGDDNNAPDKRLDENGKNIPIAADGNYTILLDLNVAGNYTYLLIKN